MTRPSVFMYSGQGSQYFQMTRELYERHPRYRLWLEYCDDVAAPILGTSVLSTIFDPHRRKSDPFDSLADSNAALLCVEYSLTRVLREMGYHPDLLLGYSLGEITAAVVAEVISLEWGLSFAVRFSRLAEQTPRSGMVAIVGGTDVLGGHAELPADCWVTGHNFDGNFVVSGRADAVARLERALDRDGILWQRLPVNYGVHTALIDPVEQQVRDLLGALSFAPPRIPIVSSASTTRIDEVTADDIWAAMRNPVEFSRTVRKTMAEGDATYIDVGPSGTLATFVKYLLPPDSGSAQVSIINRFGDDLKSLSEFQANTAPMRG